VPVHKHKLADALRLGGLGATEHVVAEGPLSKRDLTALGKYRAHRLLTLRRIQADGLELLAGWTDLRDLRLSGCKIGDWSGLAQLKNLEKLFINTIRDRAPDLSFLSQLKDLNELGLGHIPHWTAFPDMSGCTRLKRLRIFGCKRLRDLSAVLRIPNLESFHIVQTPQEPADLVAIMAMPKMKFMTGAFGRRKKDEEFHELMQKHGLTYGG
jgi:hypothetical protein